MTKASKTPEGQYIWRTVEDDRVRKVHAEFNRTIRDWSDSPDPGEEFNCRCWAELIDTPDNLHQELITPIADKFPPWDGTRFVTHFFTAFGKSVTLEETGHLRNVYQKAREVMFDNVEAQVAERMREIVSGPIAYRTESSYDEFSDILWVFGGSLISTQTVGKITRQGNTLIIDAVVTYDYFDEFTDLLDIRELHRGPHLVSDLPDTFWNRQELIMTDLMVGTVYQITGSWKTKLTGTVQLQQVFIPPDQP